ncbi:hypothetical protein ABL840_04520 [Variovorax sp. NFACC27]|jgi:hypothetical protein|uniref:DUF4148 domain-containing protein n=1 Tax=Variovorax paradoxus TaxID=34073 RepID=A0A5Q0LXD9_VARPD|nr:MULTISPECIES: hypothetical protein [Variovorax]SEF19275.1 hypothetical protein SAMN03159371_00048 [Variovorax sp. NFACC28]SEF74937.1 hypothetical protein SAMN03159365_00769 [Variovorax sp. NFACC29]SFB78688.1 hypothetical protein SAMN03159379_00768 [Variovorax sp. NFACC26]SFG77887.1 hypothetical protein SAMN03159447_04891 [Variovorax sp. NFACC27]MDN6887824.1 hypothetical protein [Variovorax sp. CAN15]
MKNTLVFIAASLLLSGAYAQSQSQEAAPQFDSRPQAVAESLKNAKPRGVVVRINDGSTAEGSGSGVMTFDRAETTGQRLADVREARPHQLPMQGGTPK